MTTFRTGAGDRTDKGPSSPPAGDADDNPRTGSARSAAGVGTAGAGGDADREYAELLAQAPTLYPGVRIGRPGRARTYWATIAALRLLRLRLAVDLKGQDHVGRGPAILLGNHVHALDPVALVMTTWWRVSAFTKLEWYESRIAGFFRWMGQIPLRRGDEASTEWALAMARLALARGGKLGMYPEGTRSPDPTKLHRLHKRILIPMLRDNPDVPVHTITTQYVTRPRRRTLVRVRLSERLPLDARTMSPDAMVALIRDSLLEHGGQTYVDVYARDVKAGRVAS